MPPLRLKQQLMTRGRKTDSQRIRLGRFVRRTDREVIDLVDVAHKLLLELRRRLCSALAFELNDLFGLVVTLEYFCCTR